MVPKLSLKPQTTRCSEWGRIQLGRRLSRSSPGLHSWSLAFFIYINDIVNNIRSPIRLFADDTSIYIIIDDPQTAAFILNSDLDTINVWANDWLVDFNPTKTTSLLISRRQLPIAHPPLEMNNVILNETTSHRHLGLTFSNPCNWSDHIQRVTNAAW